MKKSADAQSPPPPKPLPPASLREFIAQGGARRRVLAILLLVLVALALMSLVRGLASQVLVAPLLYLLWLLHVLLDGIPQLFFWFLAVFLFIRIVYPSLFTGRPTLYPPEVVEGSPPEGRAAVWQRRLQLARAGHYSKWGMARNMALLAIDIFAYQDRITLGEVRARWQHGDYQLPPEAAAYLQLGMAGQPPSSPPWWVALRTWWSARGQRAAPPVFDVDLERLLTFLENEMEVVHDREDH